MSASYSSQRGGRHLAPKTKKSTPSQPTRQRSRPAMPTAEELGSSTAHALRAAGTRAGGAVGSFLSAFKEWGTQAATGFRDAIDVGSLAADVGQSSRGRSSEISMSANRELRPSAVGLLERSSDESGLEVSMLESLGFYSDDSALVVRVPTTPPGVAPVPAARFRSQVPDLEIDDWQPHVIARSKLGSGRLSNAMVIGLSVSLLILVAMVITLLRAPGDNALRQTNALASSATELAASLSRLDALIASPGEDVTQSTALLLDVERSARDLFDRAARLPENDPTRQAAIGAAQSVLAVETALGDSLSYRVVLQPLWDSPDLAGVTDSAEAAELLATWQVELSNVVSGFPASAALEDHQEQVKAFVSAFDAWRISYLDALTAGDSATAEAGLTDLEGQLALLAQAGEDSLGAIFTAADSERSRLIRSLTTLAS